MYYLGSITGFVELLRWCRIAGNREKLIYLMPHFQDFAQLLLDQKIQPRQISAKCYFFINKRHPIKGCLFYYYYYGLNKQQKLYILF